MQPIAILLLATAGVYLIVGYIFKRYPPKNINSLYGYRTGKAMQSQKAWDLAQAYSAKHMIIQGFIFLVLGGLSLLLPDIKTKWAETILSLLPIGLILFGVIYMIYKTDKYVEAQL